MTGQGESDVRFLPAKPTPRMWPFFARMSRRMLSKSFFAVRVAADTASVMRTAATDDRPLIIAGNHVSWWDPLLGIWLHDTMLTDRAFRAPMDIDQLERFGFFRRLGVFGIDPDDAASLDAMGRAMDEYFADDERPTLWITPQGEFADVRTPLRLRPGTAMLAARTGARVVGMAIEYAFWADKRPEIFLRLAEIAPESAEASTTDWQRALVSGMTANAEALATAVASRDPAMFEVVLGGQDAKTNPLWDVVMKLRGRGGSIAPSRRAERSAIESAGG